jgi:hypothetical protein
LRVRTLPQEVVIALTSAKLADTGRFQIMTFTPRTAGTGRMFDGGPSDGVRGIWVRFGAGLCDTTNLGTGAGAGVW